MTIKNSITLVFCVVALAACSGNGSDDDKVSDNSNGGDIIDKRFDQLVLNMIDQSSSNDEPVELNALDIETDNVDENAFTALF